MDLQASATTLAVGDTLTIENVAENDYELNLNWKSLTPEVGEVTQSDGSSCTVQANACGFLKVRAASAAMKKSSPSGWWIPAWKGPLPTSPTIGPRMIS